MQGIKAAIYAYYGVTSDPASHSTLYGEDKLCMKGKTLCNYDIRSCVVNLLYTCVYINISIGVCVCVRARACVCVVENY